MKQLSIIMFFFAIGIFEFFPPQYANAGDKFPNFSLSSQTIYIPIDKIQGYQTDSTHQQGINVVYTIYGQLFTDTLQGHIQNVSEGASGTSDKTTPWKTLTELLFAYQTKNIEKVKSLYTPESQTKFTQTILANPEVKQRFIEYMGNIKGMEAFLGFEHKTGFLALVRVNNGETSSVNINPFYFVKSGSQYLFSAMTLDEPIDSNIAVFLQQGYPVSDLLKKPISPYTLTVKKTGTGKGIVFGIGIYCGSECSNQYNSGTQRTLSVEAEPGSKFIGWSGGGCSGSSKCTVTMNASTTVMATFEKIARNVLTLPNISAIAGETGSFGIHLANQDAPAAIEFKLTYNHSLGFDITKAILTSRLSNGFQLAQNKKVLNATTTEYHVILYAIASPSPLVEIGADDIVSFVYATKTGSSGTFPLTLTIGKLSDSSGNKLEQPTLIHGSVTFREPEQYPLIITKAGTGVGTVTSTPAGISCGVDCTESYNTGTVVTLTATPTGGSLFSGWSGVCSGTGSCVVTMNAAKAVTATFMLASQTLTVTKAGNGAGTVTSSPAGIACGADCAEIYQAGAVVTLTATPAAGSTFAGWIGGCAGTGACAVTMNAAKTMTALFIIPTNCAVKTVCNGNFEQGLARWGSLENAELTTGRAGVGLVVKNDGANSDVSQFMKPSATLANNVFAAGQWYQVTAWCKAAVGTKCGLYLGDANTWYNPPAYQRETRRFFAGTGDWQKISAELFLDKPEILSVYLYAPTAGSAVAYDDVAVQPLAACPERAICNGDFEQTYAFWSGTENANLTTGRTGMGLRITQDAANSDSYYRLSGVFPGGATYRVRAWCLADAGEECRLFFGDANTNYGAPYEHVGTQILPGNGQWQQLTATVALTHDEVMGINLYNKTPNSAVIYDDITIETLQPHLVWNKGTAGQAQFWSIHPITGQMLETQAVSAAVNWQAVHAQWYEDGTTTLLWRYTDGRGMAQRRRAADGALLSQRVYGPLSGWKAASYQQQGDGAATLLWMTGTGGAKLWQVNSAGTKVGELALGTLTGWVAMNHQRHADGTMTLLWRNTTNGRARVWTLNAQGQKMSETVYGPLAGWIPVNYARYADGTATLLWRNTTNGRGRVWRLNAGGEKVSEQTYIPATGWKAVAYLQAPQRYQANMITIWKTGTGTGMVTIGSSVCAASCGVMQIPVTSGVTQTVTATPTTGSAFAGWRNAKGQTLTGLEYLRAGDEVFAVFNKQ